MPVSTVAVLLAFIALCVIADVRTRRIPNWLTGAAMLAGGALNTWYFGGAGLTCSLVGLVATVTVLLFPFALGGVGGGDVKMMGAVGTLLGPSLALTGLGFGLILGGAIMAVHLVRRKRLREKLAATCRMITAAVLMGSLVPLQISAADSGAVSLPYSVPLGLGTIAVLGLATVFGSLS